MGRLQYNSVGTHHGARASSRGIHPHFCRPSLGSMASTSWSHHPQACRNLEGRKGFVFCSDKIVPSLLTHLPAITRPAIVSSLIALVVEVPVCIFLSLWGMQEFAYYISNSTDVAVITRKMWRVSLPPPLSTMLLRLPPTNREYRTSTGAIYSTPSTTSSAPSSSLPFRAGISTRPWGRISCGCCPGRSW